MRQTSPPLKVETVIMSLCNVKKTVVSLEIFKILDLVCLHTQVLLELMIDHHQFWYVYTRDI